MQLCIARIDHPLALPLVFALELPRALGQWDVPLPPDFAPAAVPEQRRQAVRQMLRHGGYRPTGRGKPSSEYLAKAFEEGRFPAINALVDACNRASLASGLPISAIDLDRATLPLGLTIPAPGAAYVFNSAGQTIELDGLLCLCDRDGPCANAVKDAQRTKTDGSTRRALVVVWGLASEPAGPKSARAAIESELLGRGARCHSVEWR